MDTPQEFEIRLDKLTEAVIYLIDGSKSDPDFGETKLVKLLYYADCAAYRQSGSPMTGATYLHFPHGPYPARWHQSKREMIATGAISVRSEDIIGVHRVYRRHRWVANRSVKPEALSVDECFILDTQLHRFANFNAAGIEAYSHRELGWLATEDGEPIPYEMAGLSDSPLSADEIEIGLQIADDIAQRKSPV